MAYLIEIEPKEFDEYYKATKNIDCKIKIELRIEKSGDTDELEMIFSKLKNKDGIPKELYQKQIREFETKTGEQGKQILIHMQDFLVKNNIDDVK